MSSGMARVACRSCCCVTLDCAEHLLQYRVALLVGENFGDFPQERGRILYQSLCFGRGLSKTVASTSPPSSWISAGRPSCQGCILWWDTTLSWFSYKGGLNSVSKNHISFLNLPSMFRVPMSLALSSFLGSFFAPETDLIFGDGVEASLVGKPGQSRVPPQNATLTRWTPSTDPRGWWGCACHSFGWPLAKHKLW